MLLWLTQEMVSIDSMAMKLCKRTGKHFFRAEIYEMDQFYHWFYPIDNYTHNLDLIVTIINVIDIIARPIKILIAIYLVICRTWLSIFTYDTLVLLCKLMTIHSRIISLSTLYLTTINMDNFKVSISISNVITKIMAQTDHMDVVLIIIAITTVMTIHNWIQRELMYVNSMKVEIFGVEMKQLQLQLYITINSIQTRRMKYFYAIITIINKIDTIINTIDALVEWKGLCDCCETKRA